MTAPRPRPSMEATPIHDALWAETYAPQPEPERLVSWPVVALAVLASVVFALTVWTLT